MEYAVVQARMDGGQAAPTNRQNNAPVHSMGTSKMDWIVVNWRKEEENEVWEVDDSKKMSLPLRKHRELVYGIGIRVLTHALKSVLDFVI